MEQYLFKKKLIAGMAGEKRWIIKLIQQKDILILEMMFGLAIMRKVCRGANEIISNLLVIKWWNLEIDKITENV